MKKNQKEKKEQRDHKKMSPAVKTLLAGVVITAGGTAVGNYFYNISVNSRGKFRLDLDEEQENGEKKTPEALLDDPAWRETAGAKDIYTRYEADAGRDAGMRLHALEIVNSSKNANGMWIIAMHGYSGSSKNMIYYAKIFYEMGFSVLLPDARGHGESSGNYRGMGWADRIDLLTWIDRVSRDHKNPEIALFGVSMGAAAVMMTEGEKLPRNVKAVIEDCGFSSIYNEMSYMLGKSFRLPSFPIMNFASAVTRVRAGYSILRDGSCIKAVARSVTPTLFIHGDADEFIPPSQMEEVYEAVSCEKEKLIIHGAGHGQSVSVDRECYCKKLRSFLSKYMSGSIREIY